MKLFLLLLQTQFSNGTEIRIEGMPQTRTRTRLEWRRFLQDDATFAAIQDIIAEQLTVEKETITPDSTFADLGADSLEIMMALEEKFDIELEQEAGETVSNAVDLIKEVIASK